MSAEAPTLFDYAATRGSSRRSDPQTSRDAGRSVAGAVLRDQQAVVLHAVAVLDRWGRSCTPWEVFQYLDTTFIRWVQIGVEREGGYERVGSVKENVVSKRLGELRDAGMVRLTGETRPGSSHRHQQVFSLTEKGAGWIRARRGES